jgi:hypothetical protein
LGVFTTASGYGGATALGNGTTARGNEGATALGYYTSACGYYGATALGDHSTACGNQGATALGYATTASGDYGATALGSNTTASGHQGATALGYFTMATGNRCTVVGQYNDTIVSAGSNNGPNSPMFIVGNGDLNTRSNALEVYQSGATTISGAVNFKATIETLTTNNQTIMVGSKGYIRISSDNLNASERVINLSNGERTGQILILENPVGSGRWRLIDQNGVNVDLSSTHDFSQWDTIQLLWNGTAWLEINFSDN